MGSSFTQAGRVLLCAAVFTSGVAASFSALAGTAVTLVWRPSVDTNVVSYKVYYGPASRVYTNMMDVGILTSATFSSLVQGSTYYFAITAVDLSGLEGPLSSEVSYSVPRPSAGSYAGIFSAAEENPDPTGHGLIKISLTGQGAYSALLKMSSGEYRFSGQLDSQGHAAKTLLLRSGESVKIDFTVGINRQRDEISGTVTGGTWVSSLNGERVTFNAQTNSASHAGMYTITVKNPSDDAAPDGNGYGTVNVTSDGSVRLVGVLADGTKISQSIQTTKSGVWPLFIPLYSGRGFVSSRIVFTNDPLSDLSGPTLWLKPSNPQTPYYSRGFTNSCVFSGSKYNPTGNLLTPGNFATTFIGGSLAATFSKQITLGAGTKFTSSDHTLTLNFVPTMGSFRGRVVDPTTGEVLSFCGAVMQKLNSGFGFLLNETQSSQLLLQPAKRQAPIVIVH